MSEAEKDSTTVALEIEAKKEESTDIKALGASVSATAMGITKNILGSGIVAMPQLMLLASIIPALLMTVVMCYLSAFSFYLIGRLCHEHECKTFQELWSKSFRGTRCENYSWIVSVVLIGMTFGGLTSYAVLFGEFGSYLAENIPSFDGYLSGRNGMILLTHIPLQFLILPESINTLRYFSLIGIVALIYFTIYVSVTGIRYLSGDMPPGVEASAGSFSNHVFVFRVAWLAPFSTLASTFMAHYNAPRFMEEMADKKDFKKATHIGFIAALVPTILVMTMGFLATRGFMAENMPISGNIIKLFGDKKAEHKSAPLIICASLYLANVVLTYPLVFISLRDSVLKQFFTEYSPRTRLLVSEVLFGTILGVALLPIPVDSVIRWKGALFAPFILFVFPSVFYFRLPKKSGKSVFEDRMSIFFFVLGWFVCLTGTTYCFLQAFEVSLFP